MARHVFGMGLILVSAGSLLVLGGCGDRRRSNTSATAGATSGTTSPTTTPSTTRFEVVIENLSDTTQVATPFSPGAWIVHDGSVSLFTPGTPDRGEGLESLAEDGNPAALGASFALRPGVQRSGETPAVPPGTTQRFTIDADGPGATLDLAAMLVSSNDAVVAVSGQALFDANGAPQTTTATVTLWDAGTEVNEHPAAGPSQPGRQGSPNAGPAEGTIRPFTHSTRSFPPAADLVTVTVTEAQGAYTIVIRNTADTRGGFVTPLAPVFWATHDGTYRLFTAGAPAPANGLETLAEDGSPMPLTVSAASDPSVDTSGAVTVTVERPNAGPGPAMPGERFMVEVTPTATARYVSLACMLVESNDAFLALDGSGVALLDANGAPRPASAVAAELTQRLQVWDAGTEADETPGAGANQPLRQAGPNTGAADPDDTVRRRVDATNDLASLADMAQVTVAAGRTRGTYTVTVRNVSAGSSFQGVLTPVVWAVHGNNATPFRSGRRASAGLEALAEDGSPLALVQELMATSPRAGAANTPTGAAAPGPLTPGGTYTIQVPTTAAASRLSLFSMVVPSNDTFLALGERGVALRDAAGAPRTAAAINADLAQALSAWDAGTEANQVGAAGPDQAPRQAAANTGAAEGNGTVRPFADPRFRYPATNRLVRITIRPLP